MRNEVRARRLNRHEALWRSGNSIPAAKASRRERPICAWKTRVALALCQRHFNRFATYLAWRQCVRRMQLGFQLKRFKQGSPGNLGVGRLGPMLSLHR